MPSTHPGTPPATIMPDPVEALYRKITRKLIPFLCFCYLAAYLDRINIGFAKLQMLDDLKFSAVVLSSALLSTGRGRARPRP